MTEINMDKELRNGIKISAKEILNSKYVIASTGAGISTESGIPDFRGPGGAWRSIGGLIKMVVKTPTAKPNPGHYALAELEKIGILKCLITQNIDNLHRAAGSRNVIEFHGNMYKLRCTKCNTRFGIFDFGAMRAHRSRCKGIVKPDIVMFGEPIPPDALQNAFDEAERCDCLIVAGTSSVVYPAAALIPRAKRNNARIIEVNAEETGMTRSVSDHFLKGKTGEILPSLVDEIKRLKEVK